MAEKRLIIDNEKEVRRADSLLSQNEPRYKIGELAEIFQLHPQTIRYFDHEGLIEPFRNEESGQRKYSNYDMYLITLRMQYRNLGFSIPETNDIFHTGDLEGIKDFLNESNDRLSEQQRFLDIHKRGLKRLQQKIAMISKENGRFSFQTRPAMWHHLHMVNGMLIESKEAAQARKILLDCMPLAYYSFVFEPENNKDCNSYVWNISADQEDAELIQLDQMPAAYMVPAEDCLHTVFQIVGDAPVNRSALAPAERFLEQNGMKVKGTIYGNAIIHLTDSKGKALRYFEAWLPWEKK